MFTRETNAVPGGVLEEDVNSFIGWVGGKRLLAKTIVDILPDHKCYVEVFGGAGWVLFKKPQKMSKLEIYNDLNADLVNLFRVVRNNLEEFCRRQYFLLASRAEYNAYQQRFREEKFKDDIERAIAFYYMLKNSFGCSVLGGFGYAKEGPPRFNTDFARLSAIRERLHRVLIENLTFDDLIPRYDSPKALFYCDPPYTMASGKGDYYQHEFTVDDHEHLYDTLRKIKGKFILSYDNADFIRELYRGFHLIETKPVRYSTNNLPGARIIKKTELIITNY